MTNLMTRMKKYTKKIILSTRLFTVWPKKI